MGILDVGKSSGERDVLYQWQSLRPGLVKERQALLSIGKGGPVDEQAFCFGMAASAVA